MAAAPPSPARPARSAADSGPAPATLRSSCFLNRSRAIWSMPKVAYSFRMMS